MSDEEIEKLVEKYAEEFHYTDNHVSLYKNNIYTITLYKNGDCISDLSLQIPEIDFGECYQKVKNEFKIEDNLVIAIVDKKTEGSNSRKMLSYSMYDPEDGEKLPADDICKDDKLIMKEDLLSKLNETDLDLDSLLFLTSQNIDIFNLSSDFYTDICYHYDSDIDKDIALKDRILIYFPNITLCDNGCETIGVNITTLKAMCECKFNVLKDSNIFSNNILYQSQIGQIEEMISNTNISIIKCYKDIFQYKFFIKCTGGFIILGLIFFEIIFTIAYCAKSLYYIRKYIFSVSNKFLLHLSNQKNNNNKISNDFSPIIYNKFNPPKKNEKLIRRASVQIEGRKNINRHKAKGKTTINKKINHSIKLNENANTKKNDSNNNNITNKNKRINQKRKTSQKKNILVSSSNSMNNSSEDKSKIREKNKMKTFLSKNKKISFEYSENLSKEPLNKYKAAGSETHNFHTGLFVNLKDDLDINIQEYLSTDIDDMDYDDAIKKDNRKFCAYFIEKIKTNQIILYTFCYYEPLKPRPIKIILFILQIDLYLFVNALFFNEEYVSEVFHLEQDTFYDTFQRFIGNCFYAALVGVIVSYIIDCFFIDEKKIKGILKREKENLFILKYEIVKIAKDIKKRYLFFIILTFIITIFSWYHISCFNNIYPHMKREWLIFSLIIIIVMQALSFLICLLESILRFISFKCKSEKIYKISLLLS